MKKATSNASVMTMNVPVVVVSVLADVILIMKLGKTADLTRKNK